MNLSRAYLDRIAAAQGPTFYLLDAPRFQENYRNLVGAFQEHYPKTEIAYSYKTNYVPRYCQLVDALGGFAEVVSSMEMALARRIGVPDARIFFNGPYKEDAHLQSLLAGGGVVNIDARDELDRVAALADQHSGAPFKLGLRCNFDVQDGVRSRFGFDVDGSAFTDALARIDTHPTLQLVGLHCHFATRSLACWQHRTAGMLAVIDRHFRHRITDLRHISLGGGMYGDMPDDLKAQFPVAVPSFADYADAAARPFAAYFNQLGGSHRPLLIIEPGTALVADAMKFVSTVTSIKDVRGQTVASLSGSTYNINPTPNRKNVPIAVFSALPDAQRQAVEGAYFGGYTCIESDYLYKGYTGRLAVGDQVVFDDVGSYSVVMKPPFILPNVAVVEPDADGLTWRLIKRRETFDDVFNTYTFA